MRLSYGWMGYFLCGRPFNAFKPSTVNFYLDASEGSKDFTFARLSISRISWSTCTVVGSFGIVAHSIDTAVGYSLNTLVYICKIRNRCFRMESQILASVLTKLIIQRITKWFFCSIPFFKLRENNRGQINFTIARPSISGIPRFTCTIVWSLGIVAHGISTAAVKSARTLIDIWKELPLF